MVMTLEEYNDWCNQHEKMGIVISFATGVPQLIPTVTLEVSESTLETLSEQEFFDNYIYPMLVAVREYYVSHKEDKQHKLLMQRPVKGLQ